MNRAQLVELLSVERHLPLPPTPKPGLGVDENGEIGIPRDNREIQYIRRIELDTAVEDFNLELRNKERRSEAAPKLVKNRRGIYVAEKKASAA